MHVATQFFFFKGDIVVSQGWDMHKFGGEPHGFKGEQVFFNVLIRFWVKNHYEIWSLLRHIVLERCVTIRADLKRTILKFSPYSERHSGFCNHIPFHFLKSVSDMTPPFHFQLKKNTSILNRATTNLIPDLLTNLR